MLGGGRDWLGREGWKLGLGRTSASKGCIEGRLQGLHMLTIQSRALEAVISRAYIASE